MLANSTMAIAQSIQTSSVLVAIVNYRTPILTINCLRSLASDISSLPNTHVVVVDNDSEDGSVEQIQAAIETEGWNHWATLLPANHNGGFSYGNNVAIRPALVSEHPPDYIWLLNSDTEIRSGALHALVEFMQTHDKVGICGSRFEEPDGTVWPIAFRFPTILSELENGFRLSLVSKVLSPWKVAQVMTDQPQQMDWLPGASMLIRREVFETIGLMDEGYFLYYEETDFCLQAARHGWECWYVPTSHVMHLAGQSTGVTTPHIQPKRLPQYWFNSRRRYFVKNYGRWYAAIADTVWFLGFASWSGRRLIQRKPDFDPPYLLQDFVRNSAILNHGIPEHQ
ncbi:glycosyltransferase family 2 protein [Leptolyngbya sp. Cla-17]|uniref:glycosyltransferase family 2 protein n=1 Tax=Leptolyngbya sp. Cla-17 TaxID=2803751 RepID=UPI0018D5B2E1|nr:glycosyltransferase family 2 protein [Leptolyngbya sp. Cla-17]